MDNDRPSDPEAQSPDPHTSPKPFQPAHGRDFDNARATKAETEQARNRTAGHIAYVLIGSILFALAYALVISTRSASYTPLAQVWAVAGPLVGALVAYYFRRDQRD